MASNVMLLDKSKPASKPVDPKSRFARAIRIPLGILSALLLVLLLFEWAIAPIVLPKTNQAWMNAPASVIRAPVDGTVHVLRAMGDAVRAGEVLAQIRNERFDMTPVIRINTEQATLEAARIRDIADLDEARRREAIAIAELEKYRTALLEQTAQKLIAAASKIEELTIVVNQARRNARMSDALLAHGIISTEEAARAFDAVPMSEQRLAQAHAEHSTLEAQRKAVLNNTYTERDTPIYLTWRLQTGQTVRAIEARFEETERRLAAARSELARLQLLIERLEGADVVAPADGVVWKIDASSVRVAKGEPIMQVAEAPGRAFVEAQFPEGHVKALSVGTRVLVAFSGQEVYTGIVQAVRQPNPSEIENVNAIKHPRGVNAVTADITLETSARDASLLGRRCRVLVGDPDWTAPVGWLAARLFRWLGW